MRISNDEILTIDGQILNKLHILIPRWLLTALVIGEMTATVGATDADKAKFLGISLLQFYLIRRLEASPPLLVCEEMAGRLGISVWEFLGVDANLPLRTD